MFPIILKDGHTPEPDAPIYFEAAANGVFEVRRTALFESVTRAVRGVPGLEEEHETCRLLGPRVPARIMEEATAFFCDVFRTCDGEGVVLLFFNPDTREYRMEVPRQTIPVYRNHRGQWYASLELRYEHGERPQGYVRCGSIHSHAELSAYASHTDCIDEENLDGIHAVVGHLDRDRVSVAASLTASGQRYSKYTYDLVEPFDMGRALAGGAPTEWLEQVQLAYTGKGQVAHRPLTDIVRSARANAGSQAHGAVRPTALPTPTDRHRLEGGIDHDHGNGDGDNGNGLSSIDKQH
jgi:hypothetical protein